MPEEETLELETLAENLSDVEAEAGVNGYGEPITEEGSIDYYAEASQAIEMAILESLQEKYVLATPEETEEVTLSPGELLKEEPEIMQIEAAQQLRAAGSATMKKELAYKVLIGNSEYYVWFPAGAEVDTTDEGFLYNATGSNLVGVVGSDLDSISIDGYNDTITVAPLLNSSGNNNAYRYGSRVYITDYYVSNNTLQSNVTYYQGVKVLEEPSPGYGFSRFQIALLFVLGVLALITIIRGLWRDK